MFDVPICFLDRLVRDRAVSTAFHGAGTKGSSSQSRQVRHSLWLEDSDEFASAVLQFFSDVK
jgi:hypothetical protein